MDLSLKVLDTPTMISISSTWLTKNGLTSIPEAAGLVPRVTVVHDELVEARPATTPEASAELVAIMRAQAAADGAHDGSLRAFLHLAAASRYWALTEDPPDDARAAAFAAMIAHLVPGGAATAQQTYVAEAGSAHLASQRLEGDPSAQKLLAGMRLTTKVTGQDIFDRYVENGTKLGELEAQRKAAETKAGESAVPATMLKARNGWIKVAGAVAAVLEQAEGEVAAGLLATLVVESDKARQRALRARKPTLPGGSSGGGAPPPPTDGSV